MKAINFPRLIQIGIAIIFLVPGIFKIVSPEAFTEYLKTSPVQIPGGLALFYPITVLEILGALLLIFKPIKLPILYPGIAVLFMGILGVALVSVVIPEGGNMFPDQIEMGQLFKQAHPERIGLNKDIFPSKIGLISILFHLFGIVLLAAVAYDDYRKIKTVQV